MRTRDSGRPRASPERCLRAPRLETGRKHGLRRGSSSASVRPAKRRPAARPDQRADEGPGRGTDGASRRPSRERAGRGCACRCRGSGARAASRSARRHRAALPRPPRRDRRSPHACAPGRNQSSSSSFLAWATRFLTAVGASAAASRRASRGSGRVLPASSSRARAQPELEKTSSPPTPVSTDPPAGPLQLGEVEVDVRGPEVPVPEQDALRLRADAVELLADLHSLPVVEAEVTDDAFLPLVLLRVGVAGGPDGDWNRERQPFAPCRLDRERQDERGVASAGEAARCTAVATGARSWSPPGQPAARGETGSGRESSHRRATESRPRSRAGSASPY